MKNPAAKTFLVLEDDADDALLIRRAFMDADCFAFVCRNTSEARAYLLGAGMYSDRHRFPFPDIFITDLRLGEESGLHFLAWVRAQPELNGLYVIVLSGMIGAKDIPTLHDMDVRAILQKPANPFELHDLILNLSERVFAEPHHEASRPRSQTFEFAT